MQMEECFGVTALLVLLTAGCGGGSADQPTRLEEHAPRAEAAADEATDEGLAEVADILFEMTNEVHKQRGLEALELHPALAEAARKHSVEMAENGYLGHESLDGKTLRDRMPADFRPQAVAENVWAGTLPPLDSVTLAKRIFAGWMESPPHRQNIESGEYVSVGVGVAKSGDEVRATQVFASE